MTNNRAADASAKSSRALVAAIAIAVTLASADAAAQAIDCAQCRAVCNNGKSKSYPVDLWPESPNSDVKHRSAEAQAAFTDGHRKDPAFGGKDLTGAITAYKRAVLIDGDSSQYRNHLAGALMASGNYEEAVYNLEHAAKLVPAEPKFLVNLGYAHHRKGDETRALIYYLRALMLDPRDVRARLFAGYALELLGYEQEAALEMRKVLNQDAKNEGARKALLRLGDAPDPVGSPPPLR